jgi:hypothetical protein
VETEPLVVPVDDRDRALWRFSRGWKQVRRKSAWGPTVVATRRAGAKARLRFSGRSVALVGRRRPGGGRLEVSVGGKSRVLDVSGRSGPRSVLWQSRRMADGEHVLRLRSLGGGPVELDAVAPQP